MSDGRTFFDVKVYGPGRSPGVMADYRVLGESARAVAEEEAQRWAWSGQASTVGVWAQDGTSGYAQAPVPRSNAWSPEQAR